MGPQGKQIKVEAVAKKQIKVEAVVKQEREDGMKAPKADLTAKIDAFKKQYAKTEPNIQVLLQFVFEKCGVKDSFSFS